MFHVFCDGDDGAGPLFESAAKERARLARRDAGQEARARHSQRERVERALRHMRAGGVIVQEEWDLEWRGRVACAIDVLRNALGLTVDGRGLRKDPYVMPVTNELPSMVPSDTKVPVAPVAQTLQARYYLTDWWREVRSRRIDRDGGWCVVCQGTRTTGGEELEVHHMRYGRLFREELEDLLTLCRPCHVELHESGGPRFPPGLPLEHARRLGWDGRFEEWVL